MRAWIATLGLVVACTAPSRGEEPPEATPRLLVVLESLDAAGAVQALDARETRLLALHVPAGEPTTPFLPEGRFRATFEGFLEVEFFEEFRFRASGRGRFVLELNGEVVLTSSGDDLASVTSPTIELDGGKQKLVARYESPDTGPALLRVDWFSYDFPHGEPLPSRMLFHDPSDARLRAATKRRLGRDLFATGRCLKCHELEGSLAAAAGSNAGMPELAMDAPSFAGIGSRLETAWMAAWISDPQAIRSQATMPRLFTRESGANGSADAAAYLATLLEPTDSAPVPPAGGSAEGERLFSALGCVSCHRMEPQTSATPDEYRRLSLAHVASKWKPEALAAFLQEPERHYAWIRMPNFQLSRAEAGALAGYLQNTTKRSSAGLEGDPERGQKLVRESGCLGCHTLEAGGSKPAAGAPTLDRASPPDRGCLAVEDGQRGRAPVFPWGPDERDALRAFLVQDLDSLWRRSPEEFAERQFSGLRCWGCHARDGVADVWANVAGASDSEVAGASGPPDLEEGEGTKLVEQRPDLTWVGEKLRPDWMTAFLGGELRESVRPWFTARMPKFATRAEWLAQGFARQHGLGIGAPPAESADKELAKVGKQLLQRGKFECVACHDVGEQRAVAVFDAKGTNLELVTRRLRKPFFHRWMMNPIRVSPETKMPSFASEGRSPFDVFDYDGPKQFEAIWHYLLELAGEQR